MIDYRIGPEQNWDAGCGYNCGASGEEYDISLNCGVKPVVMHYLFKFLDAGEEHPGAVSCADHTDMIPTSLVFMSHPIESFCNKEGSFWDFKLNQCTISVVAFEQALLGTTELGKEIIDEFERTRHSL